MGKRMKTVSVKRIKWLVGIAVYFVLIPATVVVGVLCFGDRSYYLISVLVALFAGIPFLVGFEKGKTASREMAVLAVMVAISVLGRLIFSPIPGFKPITAIVIITAVAFGSEAGFLTGSLSALISNFFFGQGPWTPFQMLKKRVLTL